MKKLTPSPPKLMAPLQGLWRWLLAPVMSDVCLGGDSRREFQAPALEPVRPRKQRPGVASSARTFNRPVRVIHFPDQDKSPSNSVGRILISGRMADVCAELDRLVANEQTLH